MPLLLVIALGWTLGIAAGEWAPQPSWAWLVLAALGGFALYLRRADERLRLALVSVVALGLGAARYQAALPDLTNPAFISAHNDSGNVTLEGIVWDEPDVRDTRTNLRVRVDTLLAPGAERAVSTHGTVLVYAPRYSGERLERTGEAEWRYGDRVRVFGSLETPPVFPDFSYADYLARQGLYSQVRGARVTFVAERQGSVIWQGLFDFKRRAARALAQIFSEPHAALLQGILLGLDSGIPAQLKAAFSATGTSHIVAISGIIAMSGSLSAA